MAEATVSDIDGKGSIFEINIEQRQVEQAQGTSFGTVGGAVWGPINTPTSLTGGLPEFSNIFGAALTGEGNPDASGLAMEYHLAVSSIGLYTRLSDGTHAKASVDIISPASVASLTGDVIIDGATARIYESGDPAGAGTPNNQLKFDIENLGGGVSSTTVVLTPTPRASDILSANTLTFGAAQDYIANDVISFEIDGTDYFHIVQAGDPFTTLSAGSGGVQEVAEFDFTGAFADIVNLAPAGPSVGKYITVTDDAGDLNVIWFYNGTDTVQPTVSGADNYIQADLSTGSIVDDTTLRNYIVTLVVPNFALANGTTGTEARFTVTNNGDVTDATVDIGVLTSITVDVATSTTQGESDYANAWVAALIGLGVPFNDLEFDGKVTVSGNQVKFSSLQRGAASSVKIKDIKYLFTGVRSTASSDTNMVSVLAEINAAITADGVSFVNVDGVFQLNSNDTGTNSTVQVSTIADDFYAELGLDAILNTAFPGTDTSANTVDLEAFYAGTDGDTIYVEKEVTDEGNVLSVFFRGTLIVQFINYSYDPDSNRYLETLVTADGSLDEIVVFTFPTVTTGSLLPPLPLGKTWLAGGANGSGGLIDVDYTNAMEEYSNVDLYDVDVIAVPENTSVPVADKLEEICKARQDCVAVVDPPFGLSVNGVINWHNGASPGVRTVQLNDWRVVTYYPWVRIPTGTDNVLEWHAPSVRAIGSISNSDKVKNKSAAPAGLRTKMPDVVSLKTSLREKDRTKLYSDSQNNTVNPLNFTTADGFTIEGQKTTSRDRNALNRINVARTVTDIKKEIAKILKFYFWEPANTDTWTKLSEGIKTILGKKFTEDAIRQDYEVTIDESNNTPAIINANGLVADISFTPVKAIEKIKIVANIREEGLSIEVS